MPLSSSLTTRRQLLVDALIGAGGLSILSSANAAPASGITTRTGDVHDFDFYVGKWTVVNRRLKKRWVGSDDWDVFPGTVRSENWLGGVANVDETVFPTKGSAGMTLHLFNAERRQWAVYWIDQGSGVLFPPVFGGFNGDEGEFHGEDTDEGRPVKVVFRYRRRGPDLVHWEQAFSLDGKQWETNWTAELTRAKR